MSKNLTVAVEGSAVGSSAECAELHFFTFWYNLCHRINSRAQIRPNSTSIFLVKNKIAQSLVSCTPTDTHLPKLSLSGVSSASSSARSQMVGLHCCVLTHRGYTLCVEFLQSARLSLSRACYKPRFPSSESLLRRAPKAGPGPVLRAHSVCLPKTRPHKETHPHPWQREDRGLAFSRAGPRQSWPDADHTQQHPGSLV